MLQHSKAYVWSRLCKKPWRKKGGEDCLGGGEMTEGSRMGLMKVDSDS